MKNTSTTPRFEGYCYDCQKFGHREYECRSHAKTLLNKYECISESFFKNHHKIRHVNKNYRTLAPVPNKEHNKGKGKMDVEQTKKDMNQT